MPPPQGDPDSLAEARSASFLTKCLRQARLDSDLVEDVAGACELNELDAVGLSQLEEEEAASSLFLMNDEARALIRACRRQCQKLGIVFDFGDSRDVFEAGPEDDWVEETPGTTQAKSSQEVQQPETVFSSALEQPSPVNAVGSEKDTTIVSDCVDLSSAPQQTISKVTEPLVASTKGSDGPSKTVLPSSQSKSVHRYAKGAGADGATKHSTGTTASLLPRPLGNNLTLVSTPSDKYSVDSPPHTARTNRARQRPESAPQGVKPGGGALTGGSVMHQSRVLSAAPRPRQPPAISLPSKEAELEVALPPKPAHIPRYARHTAASKASSDSRRGMEAAEDSSSTAATPVDPTLQPSLSPFKKGGTTSTVRSQSLRLNKDASVLGLGVDEQKQVKKPIFAHISASLLRPTKAFLAWSQPADKGGSADVGSRHLGGSQKLGDLPKQFKARPMPKFMAPSPAVSSSVSAPAFGVGHTRTQQSGASSSMSRVVSSGYGAVTAPSNAAANASSAHTPQSNRLSASQRYHRAQEAVTRRMQEERKKGSYAHDNSSEVPQTRSSHPGTPPTPISTQVRSQYHHRPQHYANGNSAASAPGQASNNCGAPLAGSGIPRAPGDMNGPVQASITTQTSAPGKATNGFKDPSEAEHGEPGHVKSGIPKAPVASYA